MNYSELTFGKRYLAKDLYTGNNYRENKLNKLIEITVIHKATKAIKIKIESSGEEFWCLNEWKIDLIEELPPIYTSKTTSVK